MNDLINNNEKFVKLISHGIKKECSIKESIKMNKKWKKHYKKNNYKFMSREEIYNDVLKLLK